jgi:hypothetical protein
MIVYSLRNRHAGSVFRLGIIGLCLLLGLIGGNNRLYAKTKPQFAPSVLISDQTIPLRGTGRLVWMRLVTVYDAALYLPAGVPVKDVLQDVPKQLELSYHISIKGPKFGESAEPYLEKNVPSQELAKLRQRIEQLNKLYRDVKDGDRYALIYAPGIGTTLSLNNVPLGTIEGADFAAVYFAIWLGAKPISDSMRDDLLGAKPGK